MSWSGGPFGERGRCVLAPNADHMTLDGTNTWVLREPGGRRSVVVDPGPSDPGHLDAVREAAGRSVDMFTPEVVGEGEEFVLSTPPRYVDLLAGR